MAPPPGIYHPPAEPVSERELRSAGDAGGAAADHRPIPNLLWLERAHEQVAVQAGLHLVLPARDGEPGGSAFG